MKYKITVNLIGEGVILFIARDQTSNMPRGMLWGELLPPGFYIYHVYVPTWNRRKRVAWQLCDAVYELYPTTKTLITGETSGDGGKMFAESYGFKYDPSIGFLHYRRDDSLGEGILNSGSTKDGRD